MTQSVCDCTFQTAHPYMDFDRDQQNFGLCSLVALTCRYPRVLSCTMLQHPRRTVTMLRYAEVGAVNGLLELVPQHVARNIFCELLNGVNRERFFEVVAPIINADTVRLQLAVLLRRLDPHSAVEVVNRVSAEKLAAALEAPPDALADVISAVEPKRFGGALIPLLHEPIAVIKDAFVPMLQRISHPSRLGAIINQAEPRVLLWIVRGVEVARLVALLDLFGPADLAPDGTLMRVLEGAADDPELVEFKVLPLLRRGDPALVVPFLRGVSAEQLLALLQRVDADNLLRLMENTNAELTVRLCNGPLEDAVRLCVVADSLGGVMKSHLAAKAVKQGTDAMNSLLQAFDASVVRGKEARGAEPGSSYHCGDVTRGVLSGLVDVFQA